MSNPQQYQKIINELQLAKKCLSGQKVAHQATLSQLEQSFNLNQQLQQVINTQANTVASLNRQLSEKTNKLSEMSEHYEMQLREVKDFVHVKDRQLQGIRGALAVTDYDMVRLRVIGQLELTHRQAIEEIEKQKERLEKLWNDEKQMKGLITQKYELLKRSLEEQVQKASLQKEEYQRKHNRQISKMQQKLQMVSKNNRDLQKSLEISQKRYQSLQQKYQTQINKVYEQLKPKQTTSYHGETQSKSRRVAALQTSLQQKNMEIQSLQKRVKNYESKIRQIEEDSEKKIKNIKDQSISQEEYMRKMSEKEKEHESIVKGYEKRIRSMNDSHLDQIKQLKRQNQRKILEATNKLRIQKQNNQQSSNYTSPVTPKFETNNYPRQKQTTKYQEQINKLQRQNEKLKKQLTRASSQRKDKIEVDKNQQSSIQQYKMKLSEANKQIVNLLLQKVSMKQQITKLKS